MITGEFFTFENQNIVTMKDAAERYSPEMAEAFQPTDTARPATKKSPAVFDLLADQKPMTIVATTVTNENARTQGSKETAAIIGENISSGFYVFKVVGRVNAGSLLHFKLD